jgi:hypothetical protein
MSAAPENWPLSSNLKRKVAEGSKIHREQLCDTSRSWRLCVEVTAGEIFCHTTKVWRSGYGKCWRTFPLLPLSRVGVHRGGHLCIAFLPAHPRLVRAQESKERRAQGQEGAGLQAGQGDVACDEQRRL